MLKTEIDYRNKKISQFPIEKYYKANHKVRFTFTIVYHKLRQINRQVVLPDIAMDSLVGIALILKASGW